jgi:hypothetical protein
MKDNTYIFDIETGPRDLGTILSFTDLDNLATGNLKDPDKIAAKREEARAKAIERAALSAITGEVVAIGWMNPDGTTEIWDAITEGEEAILRRFWKFVDPQCRAAYGDPCRVFAGWNIHGFDLPMLMQRSFFHGVKVPEDVINGRYFNRRFVDLMQFFTCGVYGSFQSLDTVARFLGFEGKCIDGIEGKTFANFWRDVEHPERREKAREYLTNDLVQTRRVAERLLGLPRVDLAVNAKEMANA